MTDQMLDMSPEMRDYYLSQFRTHAPRNGACPLCGVMPCALRSEARDMLDAAGVDLSVKPRLGAGLILVYSAQLKAHRNDPVLEMCLECGIEDCDKSRAAWMELMASGVDPATVA